MVLCSRPGNSPKALAEGLKSGKSRHNFTALAVQGMLNRLLQHHNLKVSILQDSGFFMVQLSHPYMTTGKTIAECGPLEKGMENHFSILALRTP